MRKSRSKALLKTLPEEKVPLKLLKLQKKISETVLLNEKRMLS